MHCQGKAETDCHSKSKVNVPFRFLEFFSPGAEFVVASIAIRAVHATGNAFVITATFTYAALAFDKSVATVFVSAWNHSYIKSLFLASFQSMTRIAMNFAQLLGPVVGGAIYQAGGFYLPFLTMGLLQFFMGLVCIFCLPRLSSSTDGRSAGKKISIVKVLKIPTIWFSFMAFIVATVCNGFLSINLEPQVNCLLNAVEHVTFNLFFAGAEAV